MGEWGCLLRGHWGLAGAQPVPAVWQGAPFVNSSQMVGVTGLPLVGGLAQGVPRGTEPPDTCGPPGELSPTWTLAIVPLLSFACDTRIEIGAFFFALPFLYVIILRHLVLR